MKLRSEFLPFAPPCIGEEEIAAVVQALRSGWLTSGPQVREFETAFAAYLGAPSALAVSSCTAALHLALVVHDVGAGDEVITTTMTFASTANVIEQVGAKPVFVDVEADTLNIDPERVESALTDKTRAVIAVHYAGHPADLDELRRICAGAGVALIEDAAHAVGASYKGRRVGSSDNLAAFSFYATKNLTTGEGGMLTGAPKSIDRARPLALHGMSRDAWKRYRKGGNWYYEITEPGFKYNMTDPAAAMGLVQLRRLDAMLRRRRELAALYDRAFCGLAGLVRPCERPEVESAWHLYPIRLLSQTAAGGVGRDELVAGLAERNIGTSVHFIPLHLQPYYRDRYGYRPEDFPVAHEAYRGLVSLPLHPALEDSDVAYVADAVRDVIGQSGG